MSAESDRKRVVWPEPKQVREDREWYDGMASGQPVDKVQPREKPFRKSPADQRSLQRMAHLLRGHPDPHRRAVFETALRSRDCAELYEAIVAWAAAELSSLEDPAVEQRTRERREQRARRAADGWSGPEPDTAAYEGLI